MGFPIAKETRYCNQRLLPFEGNRRKMPIFFLLSKLCAGFKTGRQTRCIREALSTVLQNFPVKIPWSDIHIHSLKYFCHSLPGFPPVAPPSSIDIHLSPQNAETFIWFLFFPQSSMEPMIIWKLSCRLAWVIIILFVSNYFVDLINHILPEHFAVWCNMKLTN